MNFQQDTRLDNIPLMPSSTGETSFLILADKMQQLLERLDDVEDRLREFSPRGKVLMAGSLKVDHGARSVFASDREVKLSPTEYRLMFELIRNAGNVVTHRDLIRVVFGSSNGSYRNLKVCVGRLRAKISTAVAHDGQCDLQSVRGVGYRLVA